MARPTSGGQHLAPSSANQQQQQQQHQKTKQNKSKTTTTATKQKAKRNATAGRLSLLFCCDLCVCARLRFFGFFWSSFLSFLHSTAVIIISFFVVLFLVGLHRSSLVAARVTGFYWVSTGFFRVVHSSNQSFFFRFSFDRFCGR